MLQTGDITFYKTAEPILAFRRGEGEDAMLCIFNLSADDHTITLGGVPSGAELEHVSTNAALAGNAIKLGANGYAFLRLPAGKSLRVSFTG